MLFRSEEDGADEHEDFAGDEKDALGEEVAVCAGEVDSWTSSQTWMESRNWVNLCVLDPGDS